MAQTTRSGKDSKTIQSSHDVATVVSAINKGMCSEQHNYLPSTDFTTNAVSPLPPGGLTHPEDITLCVCARERDSERKREKMKNNKMFNLFHY